METQGHNSELAVVFRPPAPGAIVRAGLAAPLACRPAATVRAGALSPGFERVELAIAARERRRVLREQEAIAARERRRIAREQRAAEKARLREIQSTSYHVD